MDSFEIMSTSDNSDYSVYRDELDALVDGEDDEWLYRIPNQHNNTRKTLLFSWLSDLHSPEGGGELDAHISERDLATEPSVPSLDSEWEASIDSLLDFSTFTDVKLFGVTTEDAKNYSAVDLGLDELPDEFFEPLGLESDKLQVPQDIQQYIDEFAKQIEQGQKSGVFPSHLSPLQTPLSDRASLPTSNHRSTQLGVSISETPSQSLHNGKRSLTVASPNDTSSAHHQHLSINDKKAQPLGSATTSLNSPAGTRIPRIPRFTPTATPNSSLSPTVTAPTRPSRRPTSISSSRDLLNPLKAHSSVTTGAGLGAGLPHSAKRPEPSISPTSQNQFHSRIPRFTRPPATGQPPLTDVPNRSSRLIAHSALEMSRPVEGLPLSSRPYSHRSSFLPSGPDPGSAPGSSRIPRLTAPRTGATRPGTKSKLNRHSIIY